MWLPLAHPLVLWAPLLFFARTLLGSLTSPGPFPHSDSEEEGSDVGCGKRTDVVERVSQRSRSRWAFAQSVDLPWVHWETPTSRCTDVALFYSVAEVTGIVELRVHFGSRDPCLVVH